MLAIIGGTGLSSLDGFEPATEKVVATPFDDDEVRVQFFNYREQEFVFLPRHGAGHAVPPHKVNYRANIWALSEVGVKSIVAVNAVGGIVDSLGPGSFAVPDQLIDYSHSRKETFFESGLTQVTHIDFSHPYTNKLRACILRALTTVNENSPTKHEVLDGGVYACTQGPRLETAAEIRRLKRDGCDMVGMTGMPEAALAREMNIEYASLALSVNWAAGITDALISLDEIHQILANGMEFVAAVLKEVIQDTGR
ncbi:MAG: 5'-methylthioadenosine phosphorylase [SAR86 cluster bacterium]|uniref:Probable 6-oxopurine nucleoside phosphorylase n=1 Tax=SAR86 cluster bacterium TaxID=2030880 RepID=A0A2A5BBE3_9GAMM|nr:MAG: 5'-methylthioadenosine phosphorylase [SAR86 cluster bacterium]